MKKDKRRRKKFAYFQDTGIYENVFPVLVGYKQTDIEKWVEKNCTKEFTKTFLEESRDENWMSSGCDGLIWYKHGFLLLWLKDWDERYFWNTYDILMHECMHIVQWLSEYKSMREEWESEAYLQEYLCKQIRRELNKAFYE